MHLTCSSKTKNSWTASKINSNFKGLLYYIIIIFICMALYRLLISLFTSKYYCKYILCLNLKKHTHCTHSHPLTQYNIIHCCSLFKTFVINIYEQNNYIFIPQVYCSDSLFCNILCANGLCAKSFFMDYGPEELQTLSPCPFHYG